MLRPQSSQCPICDREVGNVKNHVRMSSDEDHGPQGRYPQGFGDESASSPPSTATPTRSTATSDDPDRSTLTIDLEDDVDEQAGDVDEQDVDEALESLELGDDPADASDYECADCEDRLEYHQSECSCGEAPMWRAPVVEA